VFSISSLTIKFAFFSCRFGFTS